MLEHPKIEQLRELAELNLCDNCKTVYSSLIQPNIVELARSYFNDWKNIEWRINTIVRHLEGVYKDTDKGILIAFDSDEELEKYKDEINVEKFRYIERKGFKWKINHLKEKNILQESTYKFLEDVRTRRNKIHVPFKDFTADDFIAFSYGAQIVWCIWISIFGKFNEDKSKQFLKDAEKQAELYYSSIEKIK